MQDKHTQREKRGRWGDCGSFGSRAMGWMKERVGRQERGWAWGARWRGMGRGEALCVGRERYLVEDGMAGRNKKRVK